MYACSVQVYYFVRFTQYSMQTNDTTMNLTFCSHWTLSPHTTHSTLHTYIHTLIQHFNADFVVRSASSRLHCVIVGNLFGFYFVALLISHKWNGIWWKLKKLHEIRAHRLLFLLLFCVELLNFSIHELFRILVWVFRCTIYFPSHHIK